MKVILVAVMLLVSVSTAAVACMEPPDLTHKRKMAQLEDGLKMSKRSAADIADAR